MWLKLCDENNIALVEAADTITVKKMFFLFFVP